MSQGAPLLVVVGVLYLLLHFIIVVVIIAIIIYIIAIIQNLDSIIKEYVKQWLQLPQSAN